MLLNLINEHILYIFNFNKSISSFSKYIYISKYTYNLLILDFKQLLDNYIYILPIINKWKYDAHLSIIMFNIKFKLYTNHVITDEFYCNLNTNSINEFDKAIGYTYLEMESWLDCFSFNEISWTYEEQKFIKDYYDIFIQVL
jgi:hypothetical protein